MSEENQYEGINAKRLDLSEHYYNIRRSLACMKACAGMEDPEKDIRAMRERDIFYAMMTAEICKVVGESTAMIGPLQLLERIIAIRTDAERYRKVRHHENTIDDKDEGCEACMAAYDSWADGLPPEGL